MDRRGFLGGAVAGLALAARRPGPAWPQASDVPVGFTRLRVRESTVTVNGKTGKVYRLERDGGDLGWSGRRGDRFRVAVDNEVSVPMALHWHGLILPHGQDGVPYVTQPPIKPGERRLYDFPLVQAGTYWMHSHWGLEEQPMMTAPLIIRDPISHGDVQDVVVSLNDFTTRDPAAILAELERRAAGRPMVMKMNGADAKMAGRTPDLNDVQYDAFLANRRPLSDPDVVRVAPGRPVRLRVINMASGSNFFVSAGRLSAQAVAVDGEDIAPFAAIRFELGVAQRIDLRVEIPRGEGAYPILALGEGTDMLAGIVLATPSAAVPELSARAAKPAGALTNGQEARLRAVRPLAPRAVDRRLRVELGGDMANYVWNLNGQVWPQITPLQVKQGERVEITFVNQTMMAHPMHLHGHVFQVTSVGGVGMRGARRDTVMAMPQQTVKIEFDALYPGYWMLHCHLLYHQAAGMMTVLHYEGFANQTYDPLATLAELPRR
jgi:FtsP/CotA-like multicopper oxidase with cupredoxin domain